MFILYRMNNSKELVPEGRILSCCLFALTIDKITTCVSANVKCSLYVKQFHDILKLHLSPINRAYRLQLEINYISCWTTNHGFRISEIKPVAVSRRNITEQNLTLNGRMLLVRQSARFLGLVFDQNLTWKLHLWPETCTVKKFLVLKCLSHTKWGAVRLTMLLLYRAIIKSKLDYGWVIYGSAKERVLELIDPVHNSALVICYGGIPNITSDELVRWDCWASLKKQKDATCSTILWRHTTSFRFTYI